VSTQALTRASSGTGFDWYWFRTAGGGTLQVAYDFKTSFDTLQVYASAYDEPVLLGGIFTNGTGVFTLNYAAQAGDELAIAIWPYDEDGGDGWSYRAENVVTAPFRYQWFRHEGLYKSLIAEGPRYNLYFTYFEHAGTYSVVATDPLGSVASEPFTLTVTGPQVRIVPVAGTNGSPASMQIWWKTYDYRLQQTEDLGSGGWTDVQGAYNGMVLPVSERQGFFRLMRNE
jgi:hypothetical protein